MNQYAAMAERHWQRWLPSRYAAIPDQGSFFSALGEEAARQISELATELAGDDPAGEDYLTKVGRLTTARLRAEEIILSELILLPPEPGADPDSDDQQTPDRPPSTEIPLVVRRGDPMWEQVNSEQEELASGS